MTFLLLIYVSIFATISVSTVSIDTTTTAIHEMNATERASLESLGELYYEDQKKERLTMPALLVDPYRFIKPNFPCIAGETPLGQSTAASVDDGHKFACGVNAIAGAPIVYSFGSNKKHDFELSVLTRRPDAKVHVFELIPGRLVSEAKRDKRVGYNAVGLGNYSADKTTRAKNPAYETSTLAQLMQQRGHRYIDLLKMDIEGFEFDFLRHEAAALVSRVGQLLVEVHASVVRSPCVLLESLEAMGLRLFHLEINKRYPMCAELSFIQGNWTAWEGHKGLFGPLQHVVAGNGALRPEIVAQCKQMEKKQQPAKAAAAAKRKKKPVTISSTQKRSPSVTKKQGRRRQRRRL